MAVHVYRPGGRLGLNAGHPEVMQDASGKPLEFASVEEAVAFLLSVGFSLDDLGEFFQDAMLTIPLARGPAGQ